MLHHAATQTQTAMEGGERRAFSSWKYSHYFEFVSAKDDNVKVRCTLCAGGKALSASKTQRQIWSRSTGKLQSKSHQVVLSRELRAKPRPRLLHEGTTQTTKAGLRCKTK